MPTKTVIAEKSARTAFGHAVDDLRAQLDRCPPLEDLGRHFDTTMAGKAVSAANSSLRRAEAAAAELAQLQAISEESVVLLAVSGHAFGVVRELLTVLTAAIDARSVA